MLATPGILTDLGPTGNSALAQALKGAGVSSENIEPKKRPTIIFVGGWTSRNTEKEFKGLGAALDKAGFNVLTTNIDTTSTEGQNRTLPEFITALVQQIRELETHPEVDPDNVYIMGESFGARIAADATKELHFKGAILEVLATYPDVLRNPYLTPDVKKSGATERAVGDMINPSDILVPRPSQLRASPEFPDTSLNEALKEFHGHLLCIYHKNDQTTPWSFAYEPCGANEKKTVMFVNSEKSEHHIGDGNPLRPLIDAFIIEWLRDPTKFSEYSVVKD